MNTGAEDNFLNCVNSVDRKLLPLHGHKRTVEEKRKHFCSPLRSCFSRVAPRAYHNLCMAGQYCNATVAYAYACEERNIILQLPQKCCRFCKSMYFLIFSSQ